MPTNGNQTLGRGELHFSLFKPGTYIPAGFRYIGNTPSFGLTIESEKLPHYSSDRGIREKDKEPVIETTSTGSLVCDDIQPENLALFFFGSSDIIVQTSATAQTETFTDVLAGHSYQIGMSDANPTGVRSISTVVVAVGGDTMTAAEDYTIDAARGTMMIVEGGGIASGDDVVVTYSRAAVSRNQVISGTSQVEGCLKFIALNPEGDNIDYLMPYVTFGPNGEFNLKGDDWMNIPWSVEILKAPNRERIYADGQPYTPAP